MNDELVELVAEAMVAFVAKEGSAPDADHSAMIPIYIPLARAAIEAIEVAGYRIIEEEDYCEWVYEATGRRPF